ncbi:MAG: adenylate kinase [Candidatus Bathyarchaeota archaeon]|nr:adenylate kinase [Candidatus Bathyarchaeota archaeon]
MRGDVNTKIIFLGPPGAGKGTYSTRLSRLLDMPRISTGDIFREAIKEDKDLGKQVSEYIRKGRLVPDDITSNTLKKRIEEPDCQKGFILDGYPRTIPQAQALDEVVKIDVVLNLRIHEKILIMKLSARRICNKCGEIYNIIDVQETLGGMEYIMPAMHSKTPGICDKCGGTLIQRKDDRVEVIETRLKLYHQQSEPLVRYYRSRGLVEDISVHLGIDRTISLIMKKLKPHMVIT